MPSKKARRNQINILHNVTLKAANNSNCETVTAPEKHENFLTQQRNSSNKENGFYSDFTIAEDKPNSKRRRFTTSMYIFDEEPVFSDSDEEKEYNREILKSHNLTPCELPESVDVEVPCNLTSCEKEIIKAIKKCAGFDVGNCDEDFRKFILLCKHLINKYQLTDHQGDDICGDNPTESSRDQQLSEISLDSLKFRNISAEFLPSRNGSDDFVSESFTFRNDLCTSTSTIKAISKDDILKVTNIDTNLDINFQEKSSVSLRRSSRLRRPARFNRSGIIYKVRLNKSKKKRTNKPIKSDILKSTKTASERLATVRSKRKQVRDKEARVLNVISNDSPASSTSENLVTPKNLATTSLQHTPKVRQLYSPRSWLLSSEFASLCELGSK